MLLQVQKFRNFTFLISSLAIAIVLKMDPKDKIARQAHAETLKAKQLKRNR